MNNNLQNKKAIINTLKELKEMCAEIIAMTENLELHLKELDKYFKKYFENNTQNCK